MAPEAPRAHQAPGWGRSRVAADAGEAVPSPANRAPRPSFRLPEAETRGEADSRPPPKRPDWIPLIAAVGAVLALFLVTFFGLMVFYFTRPPPPLAQPVLDLGVVRAPLVDGIRHVWDPHPYEGLVFIEDNQAEVAQKVAWSRGLLSRERLRAIGGEEMTMLFDGEDNNLVVEELPDSRAAGAEVLNMRVVSREAAGREMVVASYFFTYDKRSKVDPYQLWSCPEH